MHAGGWGPAGLPQMRGGEGDGTFVSLDMHCNVQTLETNPGHEQEQQTGKGGGEGMGRRTQNEQEETKRRKKEREEEER